MIGMYVGIKAIDSMIIGSLALIGLSILKVPYAPLLALIVGITNMIPYFGPLVGIVISFVVTLFHHHCKLL
ncbi:putative PurR-regulated permease PerM [Clostridium butyricum]|nr:putative PurR-regulated permease PerM [Clostridium butyricum]